MAHDGSVVCPDPPTVAQTMSMQVIPAKLQEKTATIFQHGQENTQRERNSEASSLCTVHKGLGVRGCWHEQEGETNCLL